MKREWGQDLSKWLIRKSDFNSEWLAYPPNTITPRLFPSFQQAIEVLK